MGYKILLADDSVTVQKIITLTFSDEGVDVLTVNNGDEAINRLQYMRPALVMADVSIPGKNGYEICEFVKTHPDMKDTPVILLVPAFEPFDEERARRVGADQHLTKPFQSIRTLISTVKGLLEPSVQRKTSELLKQAAAAPLIETAPAETAPLAAPGDEVAAASPVEEPDDGLLELEPEETTTADSDSDEYFAAPEIFAELETERAPIATAPANLIADEPDHVLDLDDVLPEVWPPLREAIDVSFDGRATPAVQPALEAAAVTDYAQTVPQAVIDEIVERVVAQLSDRLAERLSQELARRLAPAVAELAKQPQRSQRVAYSEPDALLDLDEF